METVDINMARKLNCLALNNNHCCP